MRHRQIPSWLREVPAPVSDRPALPIIDLPSPNQDERGETVDMLILHYTGMKTARDALDRLRDPAAAVSSHYVVDEDGTVFRLVPEDRRAWHAGVSYWRGHSALNARSIGIEIVNPGHEWGYRDFPVLQLAAVCDLCLAILARHAIPARNVVGHSDVAPDRKEDPGERFDWRALAENGVGLWPDGCCRPGHDGGGSRCGDAAPGSVGLGGDRISRRARGSAGSGAVWRAARVPTALASGGGDRPGG